MDIALLLVRLVGLGFAAHGAQKLFGWFGGYGLAGTGGFFESVGFRPGRFFAVAAGLGEFAGGLLLALGFLGPVGPMLIVSVMVVAILTVHLGKGWMVDKGGAELPTLYIAVALIVAIAGPGAFSIDNLVGLTVLSSPSIAWGALGLGLLGGLANVALRRKPAVTHAPQA